MNVQTAMNEIGKWPVEQQFALAYAVLDRALETGERPPMTETRKRLLDESIASYEANPSDVYTWEEVVAAAKRDHD